MGAHVVILGAALLVSPTDSLTAYADSATASLVARAMERHAVEDTAVGDYRARLRYRLSFGLGRRRWAQVPTAAAEEQEVLVAWQRPNDLQVEIVGRRAKSRSESFGLSSIFDRPWFIPRGVGDSVRVFGTDFPERGALHPLAAEGPTWYRYSIVDSVRVTDPEGRSLDLIAVQVLPRRSGPALIAGKLWLDATTGEVVRLSFRYAGTAVWSVPTRPTHGDSAEARRENAILNRILTVDADLEYALQEGRYWMPYRQVVAGQVVAPLFSDFVLSFEASTAFSDYEINTARPIVFRVPFPDSTPDPVVRAERERVRRDSIAAEHRRRAARGQGRADIVEARDYAGWWANGRYEIHRAPGDSLERYADWGDSLRLDRDPADDRQVREVQEDLARLVDALPSELSGVPRTGFGYERLADVFLYNRVQGASFGLGYRVRLPKTAFWSLQGTVRYGISDQRVLVKLGVTRDAPGGRWTIAGYRDLLEVDPFSRGRSIGNSLNGILAAHDDADYYLAQGGSLRVERSLRRGLDLSLGVRIEDAGSVDAVGRSAVNDFLGGSGIFPPNPPVRDGTFAIVESRSEGYFGRSRWSVGVEGWLGEAQTTGRVFGEWRQPVGREGRDLMLSLKGGLTTRPGLPQTDFRVGGLTTVRGFDYGRGRGEVFWAVQADWAFGGGWIRPVLFGDAGQAGPAGALFQSPTLVGAGAGVSFLRGLARLNLSHAITPSEDGVRVDLQFRAPR